MMLFLKIHPHLVSYPPPVGKIRGKAAAIQLCAHIPSSLHSRMWKVIGAGAKEPSETPVRDFKSDTV
ncbi:hypothetical protein CapIbe_001349 [Capra ibex]